MRHWKSALLVKPLLDEPVDDSAIEPQVLAVAHARRHLAMLPEICAPASAKHSKLVASGSYSIGAKPCSSFEHDASIMLELGSVQGDWS